MLRFRLKIVYYNGAPRSKTKSRLLVAAHEGSITCCPGRRQADKRAGRCAWQVHGTGRAADVDLESETDGLQRRR
jgi:hypothetical protein